MHLNDCLSGHPVFISQTHLKRTFTVEEMQHVTCFYFHAEHEGSHSFVDLTTETKAQFSLNHIHKGLPKHLEEA